MPELPEVETLKRALKTTVVGQKILGGRILSPKLVFPLPINAFLKQIRGRKIAGVERRAKILIFRLLDDDYLLIHLKLTGQLLYRPKNRRGRTVVGGHPEDPAKYRRGLLKLERGTIFFNDLRKFGWWKIASGKRELNHLTGHLGAEPLSPRFTLQNFRNLLTRYPRRKIKQNLMDQSLIAGVGNIYADESCFAAGILPERTTASLTPAEQKKLFQNLTRTLRLAVRLGGTSANTYVKLDGGRGTFVKQLKVYGRKGKACLRCRQEKIRRIVLGGRGTHFCPRCQK